MDPRPDLWYEIVEGYDDHKSDSSRSKDHGTLSQKISVILLIYLAFGTDYPYGIAEYFTELMGGVIEKHCPRALTQPNKISSALKTMNKDKLVTDPKKVKGWAATRHYYTLNPQIIQSPIEDSTNYTKRDGFPLIIPPETIAEFFGWMSLKNAGTTNTQQEEQVRQERHKRADEILYALIHSRMVDYCDFLSFIEAEARKWDLQRTSNKQPAFSDLIHDYLFEMNKDIREWESCAD